MKFATILASLVLVASFARAEGTPAATDTHTDTTAAAPAAATEKAPKGKPGKAAKTAKNKAAAHGEEAPAHGEEAPAAPHTK